jgi:hypothetical protein
LSGLNIFQVCNGVFGTNNFKLSNGSTFHVLCVICSILDFNQASATRPIPHFTIQNILPIKLATSIAIASSGAILGIRGAGGNVGPLNLICGIKLGRLIAERSGGLGIIGITGNFTSTEPWIPGGYGISGKPN